MMVDRSQDILEVFGILAVTYSESGLGSYVGRGGCWAGGWYAAGGGV
jgi:hypothetical protein